MKRFFLLACLCITFITVNAARIIDGINYEFDREAKTAYVVKLGNNQYYTGDIVIPSKVAVGNNEFTVVGIDEYAFAYGKIFSVILPETIVEIGDHAFDDCSYLMKAYLPNGITKIGVEAFSDCKSLTDFNLPDNSELTIGKKAFSWLESLESLTIPDSWTHIGEEENYEGIFSNCGITKLTLGKNLKVIGLQAFSGCEKLTEIICPKDGVLEIIGYGAFADCKSLTSMKFIPRTVKQLGGYAFGGCSSLLEVFIPNTVESIGGGFWDVKTNSFVIEDGENPFYYYGSGRNISHPTSLYLGRPIDMNSVALPCGTSNLKRLTFGPYFKGGTEWVFGKDIKIIYSYVEDPTNVTCEFETNVYDNAILYVPVGHMDEYMAQKNFSQFLDVREFMPGIPNNNIEFADIKAKNICLKYWDTDYDNELSHKEAEAVTDIGTAFKNQQIDSFNEFKHFKGLKTIPASAFSGCRMKAVTMPYTITSIGERAFSGCSNLISITIGYNVKTIGDGAFSSCQQLEHVVIPASVTKIGYGAFGGCDNLVKVLCLPKQVPETTEYTFDEPYIKYTVLVVQEESLAAYKAAEPWNKFMEIMTIKGGSNIGLDANVNGDDDVDSQDVVDLILYIAGKKDLDFNAADVNKDGVVNVADVIIISNTILSE